MLRFVLFLAVLAFSKTIPSYFQMRTAVQDTVFAQDSLLVVEVLESGTKAVVTFGTTFTIKLPLDSTWNLCVTSTKKEQCYLVEYTGQDSIFQGNLSNEQEVLFFAQDSSASILDTLVLASDTTQEEAPIEVEQTFAESTKLKKVVLRIKRKPKRSLGQSTVSAKSIKRMPGLAEADVMKAIQALPGVVASSDFSSKIYVRGGGADQNLFLFDNGVVYSPVHFFGLFSTFLVEGVDEVNFYKGGFSPKYGNRLSSVVDIRSRKGGADSLDYDLGGSLKISTFASQAHIEARTEDWRFLAAGRITYLKEVIDLLRDGGITDLNLDYRFYDTQGSVVWEPSSKESLTVSAYHGKDALNFVPIFINWGNTVIPVNYKLEINDDLTFRATGAWSLFEQSFELQNIQEFENEISTWTIKPSIEWKLDDYTTFIQGVEYKRISLLFGQNAKVANFQQKVEPTVSIYSPYSEIKHTWDQFDFKLGLRANYEEPLGILEWEPRFSTRYNIDESQKVDFHIGRYRQYLNAILFGDFETINEFYYPSTSEKTQDILPSNSILMSLGYNIEPVLDEYSFTVEGYFKTLNNTVIFDPASKDSSVTQDPDAKLGDFLFAGEGFSYGFEVSTNKTKGAFQGGFSYSYGHSVLKVLRDTIPAKWDIPHAIKLNAQLNWWGKSSESLWPHKKKGRYFRSSTQVKWASGAPFTSTDGYFGTQLVGQGQGQSPGGPNPEVAGNLALKQGCRNCDRYPNYFRWDIKIVDMGRYNSWNFSWTILNITNYTNIFVYNYDTSENPPKRTEIAQFPFFPLLLSYEYYF